MPKKITVKITNNVSIKNTETKKTKTVKIPAKKNGETDLRYKKAQITKSDGTRDKRTKLKK